MNTHPSSAASLTLLLLVPFLPLACGDDAARAGGDGGSGAAPSAGGNTGSGAISGMGGGIVQSGGSPSGSGGSAAGAGGGPASGGATSGGGSGNVPASGGSSASGGTGGSASNGGANTSGGASTGGANATGGVSGGSGDANAVWAPLSVMAIVNPMDHGAVGNGTTDDLGALKASVDALPAAGGVVYLPQATFKKTNLLVVGKSHVKFWAPSGQSTLFQSIGGERRRQSIICQRNQGCGFFGVKFTSDAAARFDALEDNHISADHGRLVEVSGCDVAGAAAAGIMLYGSTEHYIEGNYVHHTWADHIHHTAGARESWVWANYIFNESPSKGDDGVACVTYDPTDPRCGDMEWWKNTILHSGWGRGYSVIGGDAISIHDNWAIGTAGAGVIVASEESYTTATSDGITIRNNYVTQTGHQIGHPGILVSGLYAAAGPIRNVTLTDNVSAGNTGAPYRAEGAYTDVTNTGMKTALSDLPSPLPTIASVRRADATVLRTRDVSHVAASFRPGLYRIHLRQAPSDGFQERFEYVVKGVTAAVDAFVTARTTAGDYLSEKREASGTTHAVLLTRAPIAIPSGVSGVTFRELRVGDPSGTLSWLWQRVDSGAY